MRYLVLTFLFALAAFLPPPVWSQNKHQLTITSENDSYISVNLDGYYTNGIQLAYQWRSSNLQRKNPVHIHCLQLGQNIYTSRFSGEFYEENLDRPIAGYLYGGYHQVLYNEKERYLKWGITGGVIGPSSKGEKVQDQAHKIMQIYEPTYWDRQIEDTWGLNVELAWSPQLGKQERQSKWDFKPVLLATAGTLATHAGAGAALVYGRFNKNSATAFWNNHQGSTKSDREFFGYLYPSFYLKAYDATVQGGMFNDTPEKIPGELNPFFLQARLGIIYATNKLQFGAAAVYENKQSRTQFSPQYYGSLQVAVMW